MKRVYINPSTECAAVELTNALLALSKLNTDIQQGNGETLSPARKLYV